MRFSQQVPWKTVCRTTVFRAPAGKTEGCTLVYFNTQGLFCIYYTPRFKYSFSCHMAAKISTVLYEMCDMNIHIIQPYQIPDQHCKITWMYSKFFVTLCHLTNLCYDIIAIKRESGVGRKQNVVFGLYTLWESGNNM